MATNFDYTQRALQHMTAQTQRWYAAFFPPMVIDLQSTAATAWQEDLTANGGVYPLHPGKAYLAPFTPHVNLGPTMRLGFVGENVSFWAGDSFLRGGSGVTSDAVFTWAVTSDNIPFASNYAGPSFGITPQGAGLFTIACTCTMQNGASHTAYRYLKVYADRDHAYDAIVNVASLQGDISQGGWGCQLTVQQGQPALSPYSGVLLYAEDVFGDAPILETIGPGSDRYDPHLVMCGYVIQEQSQRTYNQAPATLTVQGPYALLQDLEMFDTPFTVNSNLLSFGHFLQNMTITDVIWHLLQDHTAFASWHDLTLAQNEQQFLSLAVPNGGGIGALWDGLKALTDNEYYLLFCDKGGGLHAEPDRSMNGPAWWGSRYYLYPPGTVNYTGDPFYVDPASGQLIQPPVHFSDRPFYDPADNTQSFDVTVDPLALQIDVRRRATYSYVKFIASMAQNAGQMVATYPVAGAPDQDGSYATYPTSARGQWAIVTDKYVSDTPQSWAWLWQVAYRLYLKANAPFPTVQVTCLGRLAGLDLNDLFWVTGTDPLSEATLSRAPYTAQTISYTLDQTQQTTQTAINGAAMTYDGTSVDVPPYNPGVYNNYANSSG